MSKLLIYGPPASGKGTLASLIEENLNIIQIAAGDILRDAVKNHTQNGEIAAGFMSRGELVPDQIVTDLVFDKLRGFDDNWLLDGFPRNLSQAEALFEEVQPTTVIVLDVDSQEILYDRITGRRVDKETNKSYHLVYNPPPEDIPEERLVQREDDTADALKKRLEIYYGSVNSLLEFFDGKVTLIKLVISDGLTPDDVYHNFSSQFSGVKL